jgi:secondary thiamine-phosphate synthase enzyme
MELHQINVKTSAREQIIDITDQIRQIIMKSRLTDGFCQIFIPHTTAGITINENADSNVKIDFLHILGKLILQSGDYLHSEGNSDAHVKASLVGFSQNIFISKGELLLGTWQGLWFCEFDGPRTRKVLIRLEAAKE